MATVSSPTHSSPAPLVVAHRGASAEAPEHTIAAYERALAQGADALALDVHLSADGHPVVIHDATLERTTDGAGPVGARTLRELKRLDAGGWRGAEFRGQRVQALQEVLERFRERARFWVRLDGGRDHSIEERVVSLLEIYDALEGCLVYSARPADVGQVRRLNPAVGVGLLVAGVPAKAALAAAEGTADAVGMPAAAADQAAVAAVRATGLACHVWTVDEPALASRLVEWGVNGLVTGRPGVIRTALRR